MSPFRSPRGRAAHYHHDPFEVRVRRAISRFCLGVLACVLVVVGYHLSLQVHRFLYQTDFFKVQRIAVFGASEKLEADARARLDEAIEKSDCNLLKVSPRQIETALARLPRSRQARVRKIYPDVLRVDFVERRPLMIVNLKQPYLMDEQGVLIDTVSPSQVRRMGLPVLTGVRGMLFRPGDRLDQPRLKDILEAARFIHQNDDLLQRKIVEWNIGGREEVTAVLRSGSEVRFGTQHPLELLDKLSGALVQKKELEQARYIDLRMERQIVYR